MKKRTVIATLPLLSAAILGGVAESTTTNYVQAKTTASTSKKTKLTKPSKKPAGKKPTGKKMGTPPKAGKGGANTQSYDYTGTLSATVNVSSGTKSIGKTTIKNSKWVVTGNSTISNLNLEDGGSIVDSQGNNEFKN